MSLHLGFRWRMNERLGPRQELPVALMLVVQPDFARSLVFTSLPFPQSIAILCH